MISLRRRGRWLVPGWELYKPVCIAAFGLTIFILGAYFSFRTAFKETLDRAGISWNELVSDIGGRDNAILINHSLGGILLLGGLVTLYFGVRGFLRVMIRTLSPNISGSVSAQYFRRQMLARGPKVVAIGGGTGLSTLLRGLKRHSSNITAIVTVTDDGGSSGRLSEELGILPPGDIRNCLVALADSERELTDIFQYRFRRSSGSLSGHSLGNLLLAGLIDLNDGDFERALSMASDVLSIRGRVIPSSLERLSIKAEMEDGEEIRGETRMVVSQKQIRRIFLEPKDAHPHPEALVAIAEADIIVIGPGSVFTSILPNLLVPGIADAMRASKAKKVYVCNVMTQRGESDTFTAAEHLLAIESNINARVFEYVLVNTQLPSSQALEKYQSEDQFPVEPDLDRVRSMGFLAVEGNYMSESDYVRHDPMKVADAVLGVMKK